LTSFGILFIFIPSVRIRSTWDYIGMRIVLTLSPKAGDLVLPLHYNRVLQGFLYSHMGELGSRLHEEGVRLGKRRFKFFTFSRLFGRYEILKNEGAIKFYGPLRFYIGSVLGEVLESLAEGLLKSPGLRLAQRECELKSLEVEPTPQVDHPEPGWAEARVRTLSPITVYRTLYTAEGRKKTYFPTPYEDDFEELLLDNLERKASALGWEGPLDAFKEGRSRGSVRIRPIRPSTRDLKVFKLPHRAGETVVKAWTGIYELRLPEPFFWLAYDSGLGSKNAQGFGMVEVVSSNREVGYGKDPQA